MTLKTFHFAGVANMHVTQGVPRIKEIINASPSISTPIITCELITKDSLTAARVVKGRVEQTFLKDVFNLRSYPILPTQRANAVQIITHIEDVWSPNGGYLVMKVDLDIIGRRQLDVTMQDIHRTLLKNKKLHLTASQIRCYKNFIRIYVMPSILPEKGTNVTSKISKKRLALDITKQPDEFLRLQALKRALPDIAVSGHVGASRAVIKTDRELQHALLVEGYGLGACLATRGVDSRTTRTNNVIETKNVLGIEAARLTIIAEVDAVMAEMDIDPRHIQLLADVMTYRGEVLGITRFGLAKMRDSVLQLASFEKTPDHLFDAAWHGKTDRVEGVSECIIMGQSVGLGTGAMKVVRRLGLSQGDDIGRKPCAFEDAWADIMERRRRTSTPGGGIRQR